MTATAAACLGLIAWMLLLTFALVNFRAFVSVTSGKAANTFSPAGEDMPVLGQRLTRAHANCYEGVPFILAILLYALAMDQTAVTNGLAMIVLYARIGQGVIHLVSTSVPAVFLRFAFLLVQLVIGAYWVYLLFNQA